MYSESLRFTPRVAQVRRENLLTALLLLIAVPALLSLRGESNLPVLLAFGLAAALLTYGFYEWRFRHRGLREIVLTETALIVHDRKGEHRLPWRAIENIQHTTLGGERWIFTTTGDPKRFTLWLEGFTLEETALLSSLIEEKRKKSSTATPALLPD